ncbi:serine/threonine-protein kinase AFC2 isoform X2 [Rhodamnia argentea]|uniref:Serine/threonine-protein kinase AFC2 isoform X2 n=1 Tax=Rhodamnia argentea TaxID=178133 RepID=A0ABM3H8T9_9MYRT|nr:serine/threonine-protein kinase AFC2 isoform X2 [Rhodamnia argentea]
MEKERVRKRPRLTWDVPPPESEARDQSGLAGNQLVERHSSPPKRDDDREGHYVFNLGENLTPRYKILSKMGEGTFGRVLECWDRQTQEYVAVKVVRSIKKYRDAAMIEVDILQLIAKNDRGSSRCVQIRDWFDYRNHICIIILFYKNYWIIQRTNSGAMQYRCLPKSSAIKVIDFGSTAYDNQNHSSIVSTRHYRAPEVILGLGWSYPCDLWSLGCILIELCTGEALFQTHENLEHLAMMERVLGPLPEHMIRGANRAAEKYFRQGSRLNWPEGAVSRESIRAVKKLDSLQNLVSQHADSSRSSLTDLLRGLLKCNPSERLTAREALKHPFFKDTA